jgi:predicted esterase
MMNGLRCGVLLFLLGTPSQDRAADYPAFSAGQSDLAFQKESPLSTDAELQRRFGTPNAPPSYDVAKEKFRVVVPRSYKHADAWGLFVWIDASPQPVVPSDWGPILAEKRLLLVAAHGSGNSRSLFARCRLAVDAVHNMKQRFHIDPGRVYVSGHSGGGRVASMLGVAYSDVFTGAFPMVGVNFYKPVPAGEPNRAWLPVYHPEPRVLASAKAANRYVLLTGEKDFNRENTLRVYRDGFQAEEFRHVLYLEVPGMGHARPSAEWLAKGLEFLDARTPPGE